MNWVRRIYLDELEEATERSLGVEVVKLVIEPEETAGQLARQLITQAQQQLTDETLQRELINLIETIIVYKLPKKSREEIAAMLGLSEIKQTRFYQETLLEMKLETIPRLLPMGLDLEQISHALDLPLETVKKTVNKVRREQLSFPEQNVDAYYRIINRTPFSIYPRRLS